MHQIADPGSLCDANHCADGSGSGCSKNTQSSFESSLTADVTVRYFSDRCNPLDCCGLILDGPEQVKQATHVLCPLGAPWNRRGLLISKKAKRATEVQTCLLPLPSNIVVDQGGTLNHERHDATMRVELPART